LSPSAIAVDAVVVSFPGDGSSLGLADLDTIPTAHTARSIHGEPLDSNRDSVLLAHGFAITTFDAELGIDGKSSGLRQENRIRAAGRETRSATGAGVRANVDAVDR
jgi:hypothetical protein